MTAPRIAQHLLLLTSSPGRQKSSVAQSLSRFRPVLTSTQLSTEASGHHLCSSSARCLALGAREPPPSPVIRSPFYPVTPASTPRRVDGVTNGEVSQDRPPAACVNWLAEPEARHPKGRHCPSALSQYRRVRPKRAEQSRSWPACWSLTSCQSRPANPPQPLPLGEKVPPPRHAMTPGQ